MFPGPAEAQAQASVIGNRVRVLLQTLSLGLAEPMNGST
jgi:hypothetical protein